MKTKKQKISFTFYFQYNFFMLEREDEEANYK